jgi:hypothetical protein
MGKNWACFWRQAGGKWDQKDRTERLGAKDLRKLPKSAPEKTALAWWLRERTTVSLRWVSQALAMGHHARVTQAVSRMQRAPGSRLEKLKHQVLSAEEKNV